MADKRLGKEQGASGTTVLSGQIYNEEFNTKFRQHEALKIYDEMRRSDATVNAAMSAIKLPIQQADYSVNPATEDDADQEVAMLVEKSLFEFVDWPKFMIEALTCAEFGFSLFEMVFEPKTIEGKDYIVLTKLGYRKQTSVQAWETETSGPGITQFTGDGKKISIPIERLVRFTPRQEGDNYEGISMLRSAYKHWYIKDTLYKIDAMGHERQGLGVLDITKPSAATKEEEVKMVSAARNLRANSQSYIMHPVGWGVQFMDMKAKSMKDIEPSINHHDRQITKNVLAQFLELGATGGAGSRALSQDHSRLFGLAVQSLANYLVHVINDVVVETIVDLNFTDREYPKLGVSGLNDSDVPVISAAFKTFVDAGVLHPTAKDENVVRKMLNFGELSDDELDAIYEPQEDDTAPTTTAPVKKTPPDNATDPESDANDKQASLVVSQAKELRASIEGLLYDDTSLAA